MPATTQVPRPWWPDGGFTKAQQGWAGRPGGLQGLGSERLLPSDG
jgi:hypothetical protein